MVGQWNVPGRLEKAVQRLLVAAMVVREEESEGVMQEDVASELGKIGPAQTEKKFKTVPNNQILHFF